jgi:heat shock protein HspQ
MNDESTMKCEFPSSIEIETREIFENAEPSIKLTSRGIVIDLRPEKRNAYDSMRFSREPFSNEIDESDLQFKKHDEQRISTFRGIVIDLRPQESNAYDSMRFSRESFSNEIDESDLQFKKHDEQRISILKGIVT